MGTTLRRNRRLGYLARLEDEAVRFAACPMDWKVDAMQRAADDQGVVAGRWLRRFVQMGACLAMLPFVWVFVLMAMSITTKSYALSGLCGRSVNAT